MMILLSHNMDFKNTLYILWLWKQIAWLRNYPGSSFACDGRIPQESFGGKDKEGVTFNSLEVAVLSILTVFWEFLTPH